MKLVVGCSAIRRSFRTSARRRARPTRTRRSSWRKIPISLSSVKREDKKPDALAKLTDLTVPRADDDERATREALEEGDPNAACAALSGNEAQIPICAR